VHRRHGRGGGGIGIGYALLGFVVGVATENAASEIAFASAMVLFFVFKFAGRRNF